MTQNAEYTRPLYVPALADHYDDNPHVCILTEDCACLTCALIEVMGDEQREYALSVASRLAAQIDPPGGLG